MDAYQCCQDASVPLWIFITRQANQKLQWNEMLRKRDKKCCPDLLLQGDQAACLGVFNTSQSLYNEMDAPPRRTLRMPIVQSTPAATMEDIDEIFEQ